MISGSIDRKKTAQLQKRNKRKQLDTIRKSKHAKTEGDANIETGRFDLTETDNDISSGEEEEDSDSSTDEPPSTKASSQLECNQNAQNRMSLPTLAKICDRFCVFYRAGISIAVVHPGGVSGVENPPFGTKKTTFFVDITQFVTLYRCIYFSLNNH